MGQLMEIGTRKSMWSVEPEKLCIQGIDATLNGRCADIAMATRLGLDEKGGFIRNPDGSLADPENESMVLSIMAHGVRQPVSVAVLYDTNNLKVYAVNDGRRRVLLCREANRRLKKAGEPLRDVPCVPIDTKKTADSVLELLSVELNEIRKSDDIAMKIRKAQRMHDMGIEVPAIAIAFGKHPATIELWLKAGNTAPEVQQAMASGALPATAAAELAALPTDQQAPALATLAQEGGKVTARRAKAVVAATKAGTSETAPPPSRRDLRRLYETPEAINSVDLTTSAITALDGFKLGLGFALGLVTPRQVKGLTAALKKLEKKPKE